MVFILLAQLMLIPDVKVYALENKTDVIQTVKQNAVKWIESIQNEDGSWGDLNPVKDTSEILCELYDFERESDCYLDGLAWLKNNTSEIRDNDSLARVMRCYCLNNEREPLDNLLKNQNSDGGYGVTSGKDICD